MPRLNLEDIQQEVKETSWKLCSVEYKNLDTEMEFDCPTKHKVFTTLKKWRRHRFCPVCVEQENTRDLQDKIPKKEKGVIRVLALDDSTSTTGWAIFDDSILVGYGKISMNSQDVIKRMSGMRQWMVSAIHNWKPDVVGIEDIQLQKGPNGNVSIFKVLAQLQGVLLVTLEEEKMEKVVVHSATWRSDCNFTTKTRADQKREAQKLVRQWYNEDVTQDEADAICIGRYLANKYVKNNFLLSWGEES